MTLTELKTLIQNYVENEETTFVSTLNDFIINAEDRIFELIQLDYFRKNVTGNLTAGNTYLTAPSDFLSSFSLAVIDSNDDYHYLDKKHTTFMREYSNDAAATSERGRPLYYGDFDKELSTGTDNGSTLIVSPVPDTNYSVELHYLYKPTSLTSSTTGTWISQNARNALLYGSLIEAYTFMKGDADLMQTYEQRFNLEVLRLKNQAEARGRRDEYRYDSLRTSVS
jgi:hypothetical protein|tara:strand:+ start:1119 stop:1793 length:675 start_codon:yes stop_codon:yes gene_type:complete